MTNRERRHLTSAKKYEYNPAVDDWPPAYIPTSETAYRQGTRARKAGLAHCDCPYTKPQSKDMWKALDWLLGFEYARAKPRVDEASPYCERIAPKGKQTIREA